MMQSLGGELMGEDKSEGDVGADEASNDSEPEAKESSLLEGGGCPDCKNSSCWLKISCFF